MDLSKTILRIVQDYCFNNSASILSSEFAIYIESSLNQAIAHKTLTVGEFKRVASKRRDFFVGNSLNVAKFCKGLFDKLNYELSFIADTSLLSSLKEYKRKIENGLCKGFPKKNTSEDALRSTLALYIKQETFCEPRSGTGNNDITIPSERTIIETKLWNGPEYYNAGIPELCSYLKSYDYSEGYYVIFDYNKTPNEIIKARGEIFDITHSGKHIHVIFIRMNATAPSKLYAESKKSAVDN